MFRKFESFIRFSASSVVSFLVDFGLFTLLNALLLSDMAPGFRELAATGGARVVSCVLNYVMNRKLVFHDAGSARRSAIRYTILAIVQAAASAGLVRLLQFLTSATPLMETVLKLPVDAFLFLSSYTIQKRWVFPDRR